MDGDRRARGDLAEETSTGPACRRLSRQLPSLMKRLLLSVSASVLVIAAHAAEPATAPTAPAPATPLKPKAATPVPGPQPTMANVAYGTHPKQVLDFYKAESATPTPVVFYIHGGGWQGGSKDRVAVANYLRAGISVVSVEYRFIKEAEAASIQPPVKAPLEDAARALQFVRSKAADWNIDKTRIGATGGSAGACSSLWLAFHNDMANPKSTDPIARESTRLTCAAVSGAQTTLDPQQMKEWTPNSKYGGHAFGFIADPVKKTTQFDEFLAGREKVLAWIKEYSPYEHVSKGDPAIYLHYNAVPALGQEQKDPTHTANFGVKLQEHCKANGVECELVYPGVTDAKYNSIEAFLLATLKQ